MWVAQKTLVALAVLGASQQNSDYYVDLNADSAQRLAVAVDVALTMARASEQLAGTSQSLNGELDPSLHEPLQTLGRINEDLRRHLQELRDELGSLFTSGESLGMRSLLDQMTNLHTTHMQRFQDALARVPAWTDRCGAAGTHARYEHFKEFQQEIRAVESKLNELNNEVFSLRAKRAAADGRLAGLEQHFNQQRGRRPGEEYTLARYLGSSLVHWDLLRTKVAHHLATTFTAAREQALAGMSSESVQVAEAHLGALEADLQNVAAAHKELAEQRVALGKQARSFLKSLLVSCEAASGDAPLDTVVSKRFQIVRSKSLGVAVQALEELARFLSGAFSRGLPALIEFLKDVLAPYAVLGGQLSLPKSWKAKPKIGRWWEWLDDDSAAWSNVEKTNAENAHIDRAEFERRFGMAKRQFSVHISASQPAVMAYLLWLLLEEVLGPTSGAGEEEVLALPGPMDS